MPLSLSLISKWVGSCCTCLPNSSSKSMEMTRSTNETLGLDLVMTRSMNETLGLDLVREILLRLPVRYVLRCKSVCKSWHSLISNPQFAISHYDLALAPTYRLLLISSNPCNCLVGSIDTNDSLLHPNSTGRLLVIPRSHTQSFYSNEGFEIVGSCRGFILLYYMQHFHFILWNPTLRRVHKQLPSCYQKFLARQYLYGFGYDKSTNEYLVISILFFGEQNFDNDENKIQVYSFTETNLGLGNRYEIIVNFPYTYLGSSIGTLFNGALHWLVFSKDIQGHVIIALDLTERSLSEIPLVDHLTQPKYSVSWLREIGGCLTVSCSVRHCSTTEIWVMKEYKVQSSWTKSYVIPIDQFYILCITRDGGILGSNASGRLEKRNDQGELLDQEFSELYMYYRDTYVRKRPTMYRETLFSLW